MKLIIEIDKEQYKEAMRGHFIIDVFETAVKNGIPLSEKKEGYWIREKTPYGYAHTYCCSECGNWQSYGRTPFCPNCGAKMSVRRVRNTPTIIEAEENEDD